MLCKASFSILILVGRIVVDIGVVGGICVLSVILTLVRRIRLIASCIVVFAKLSLIVWYRCIILVCIRLYWNCVIFLRLNINGRAITCLVKRFIEPYSCAATVHCTIILKLITKELNRAVLAVCFQTKIVNSSSLGFFRWKADRSYCQRIY